MCGIELYRKQPQRAKSGWCNNKAEPFSLESLINMIKLLKEEPPVNYYPNLEQLRKQTDDIDNLGEYNPLSLFGKS